MKTYKTEEVFVAGGMPEFTYVARGKRQLEETLGAAKGRLNRLVVITGDTKSGKTVLTRRIFPPDQCIWIDGGTLGTEDDLWSTVLGKLDAYTEHTVGAGDETTASVSGDAKAQASVLIAKAEGSIGTRYQRAHREDTRKSRTLTTRSAALEHLRASKLPLIIDDFHFLAQDMQRSFVKGTKGHIFDGCPIILIAIPHRRYDAVKVEREMIGRLHYVRVPPWERGELMEIAQEGFPLLNISISEELSLRLAHEAHGSPHLMQEFCFMLATQKGVKHTTENATLIADIPPNLFASVAESIGRSIFDQLARVGARARTRSWPVTSGSSLEMHKLLLHALAHLAPGPNIIEYSQLREAVRQIVVGNMPVKREIIQALEKLSAVASEDKSSIPVIDWNSDEHTLHVTDPFFAFYLKWGTVVSQSNIEAGKPATKAEIESSMFNDDWPLGPVVTPPLKTGTKHPDLFDIDTEAFRGATSGKTLIVGRRGSGKSALLRRAYFDNPQAITIEIDLPDSLVNVVELIAAMPAGGIFVEQIAEIWNNIFWSAVIHALATTYRGRLSLAFKIMTRYLEMPAFEMVASGHDVISIFLSNIAPETPDSNAMKTALQQAKIAAVDFMNEQNASVLILIDSLERYPLHDAVFGTAVSGLLRSVSTFGGLTGRCHIRCSIPSEIFEALMQASSNPAKDFSSTQVILWTPHELLELAARRYSQYIRASEAEFFVKNLSYLDLSSRGDVRRFWQTVLPDTVVNKQGTAEAPMTYVMRHTQFLPRQLLNLLNRIVSISWTRDRVRSSVSEDAVRRGIEQVVPLIAEEILMSYASVFPELRDLCINCIPDLPSVFDYGTLHKVYNRRGRRVAGVSGFHDFLDAMSRVGALGRVVGQTKRYTIGEFAYERSGRMILSSQESLCLHPIFTDAFNSRNVSNSLPIYPHRSMLDFR